MFSDKLLVNCRNLSTEVKKKYSACKQFFFKEIEARIVAAAMSILGLQTMNGTPSKTKLPPNLETAYDKKCFLDILSYQVVDTFVMNEKALKSIALQQKYNDWLSECNPKTNDGRYKCRLSTCDKTFRYDGKIRKEHEKIHGFHSQQDQKDQRDLANDDMMNYQCSLLEFGMIQLNFHDAILEGDGERVLQCWKFMLPYLRKDGAASRKYAVEALYLLLQTHALLPERDAHRLIWNRFHKARRGQGGNIPLDMALEHNNLLLKTIMRKLGSNATNKTALDRLVKALHANKALLDNYDVFCGVIKRSGKHFAKSAEKDLHKIIAELVLQNAMEYTPGRSYKSFPLCRRSLLEDFSIHDFYAWINEHKRRIIGQNTAR